MKKRDRERIKEELLKMKRKLGEEVDNLTREHQRSQRDASGDLSGYSFHMADVATDNFDREFSMQMASNERDLYYLVEEALQHIEEGTYGTCQLCKGKIGLERLKAIPYANNCLECQASAESGETPD